MILGPDDPRAVTGDELEAARENTAKWRALLDIKDMTPKQRERYERELAEVLDLIGWDEDA